jgi:hypothetical protein
MINKNSAKQMERQYTNNYWYDKRPYSSKTLDLRWLELGGAYWRLLDTMQIN